MLRFSRQFIFASLFALIITGCSTGAKIISVKTSYIQFSEATTPEEDTVAAKLIEPYRRKMQTEMNAVLARCEQTMFKNEPEGELGNFIADLILAKANQYCRENKLPEPDICLLNNGGLRTTLPKGDIIKKRIYELMPFENEIVVLTLSGQNTKALFDFIARINGMPLAGARMGIKNGKSVDITINGKPLDINKQYRVATSDYLAKGGDKMQFFLNPVNTENLGHKLRDAILEFITEEGEKGNPIKGQLDGRIHIIE